MKDKEGISDTGQSENKYQREADSAPHRDVLLHGKLVQWSMDAAIPWTTTDEAREDRSTQSLCVQRRHLLFVCNKRRGQREGAQDSPRHVYSDRARSNLQHPK